MRNVLDGFESAIKSCYPGSYDEICKFAQIVSSQVATVTATFDEKEFPQFMAKLDHYRGMGGRSELILGWENRATLAAQISRQVDGPQGAFLPNQWGFTLIDLGQHRFIFISWDKDRNTRLFWNGRYAGRFQRISFWRNFIGGSFAFLNPDDQIQATFTFPNLLASLGTGPSWTKIRVQYADVPVKIAFPNRWPTPGGGISSQLVADFAGVPFDQQITTIAVLLWSNNSA